MIFKEICVLVVLTKIAPALEGNPRSLEYSLYAYVVYIRGHGLSQYLETGCPNRGFLDFCVSKVWYKVHTTNKINPLYLYILLFRLVSALCVL